MIKEFHSLNEIQKYYYEKSNTYVFKENGKYINTVVFNFDLDVKSNIHARNIHARNINVWDINAREVNACNINACNINVKNIYAWNINAKNINAKDINYYAVCYAYENIKCKSIKGRMHNAKHFVLDGKMEVEDEH